LTNGAQVEQVDEPHAQRVVVCFEFEAYPEPKALSPDQLQELYKRLGSFVRVGQTIGTSEGFVRQNMGLSGSK
jgi:hypothetical protein